MVRVVGVERFLDASALEASLAARREFTAPGPGGEHCYHAVRLVLRIALMHGKEAFCERAGSIVHQIWDPQCHWHAGRVGDRLQMRMIGLMEHSPLRESVVREITDYIWDQGKNPVVRYGQNRGKPGSGAAVRPRADVLIPIRLALRESSYSRAVANEVAQPTSLDIAPPAAAAVQHALDHGKGGALEALPMFQEDERTVAHDRTTSVVLDALQNWVASKEGANWRARRQEIFGPHCGPLPLPPHPADEGATIEDVP